MPALDIQQRHHYLPVKSPRSEQSRVQYVRPVGGGNQDNTFVGLESVHFYQQLIQGLLPFIMTAAQASPPMSAHGVYLVNIYNTGRVLLPLNKQVPDPRGA